MTTKHQHGPAPASRPTAPVHHSAAPPVAETPPANLPIPPRPATRNDEAIRARAYHLWEAAGRPEGDGTDFWWAAEREMNGQ